MTEITVCAVGRLKERHYIDACDEYVRRLLPYCRVEIREISEARLSKSPSPAEIEGALASEASRIPLPKRGLVVALAPEGEAMDSAAFSGFLGARMSGGESRFTFLVGGSHGLDEALKARADVRLSLSRMTFPHHLARVILLEQLYRAHQILAGGKYHK